MSLDHDFNSMHLILAAYNFERLSKTTVLNKQPLMRAYACYMKAYVRIILRASQGLMFDFFSNCSFLVPARQTRIVDPVYTAFRVKELHPNALQTRLFLCPPLRRSVYSTHCVPMRPEF